MLAKTVAATPWGIEAHPVDVEIDLRNGLPRTYLVGLPDTAVRESRERVWSAVKNCGFKLPGMTAIVNLAPADLRKEGNHLDLAIAIALMMAYKHLPAEVAEGRIFCGELGLDGSLRPVRGSLALAELSGHLGYRELVLPAENAAEAAALGVTRVTGAGSLSEAIAHLLGRKPIPAAPIPLFGPRVAAGGPDLGEVMGQAAAKRGLEIAAAGGHNLLLLGPPGTGKTMLARCLPGLLPSLRRAEAIAATKIHSLAGQEIHGLLSQRPFRAPHTQTSTAALIGGGRIPRPGEVSLAHGGVLFLDELPEFRRDTLEALRQPLEDGEVSVVRTQARFTFPARFTMVAAMNPCPCGHLGDPRHDCRCPPATVDRYRARVSGPLLDRIDLHIEVAVPTLTELGGRPGEASSEVSARIAAARSVQAERFGTSMEQPINAAMGTEGTRRFCLLDWPGQKLLDTAYERLGLSARAVHRILRVARTVADLEGEADIRPSHVAEAVQYRCLDRRSTAPVGGP